MKRHLTSKLALGAFALGTALTASASAQCGPSRLFRPMAVTPQAKINPEREAQQFQPPQQSPQPIPIPSIVGLWKVTYVSDGQTVDVGFDQWNPGGGEILNDTPPPASGNVCLGVWVQVGQLSYKLKHPSWTFDNAGNLTGTAIIREQPVIDTHGNTFKGPFTFDVYDLNGNLLEHAAGIVTGERITVD
ncbi:MAG TPA: hypothetical protein VKT81_27290 [Bryobacteraceae bacterium]|nr:hypothetical protein [Bryobacteraceae bacterium]